MQILSDVNLEKNQILNAIIQKVPSDPTPDSKSKGMLIYNITDNKLKYCNGTEWIVIGSGSGGGTTISIDTTLSDNSTNDNAAGSKAVVDYVNNAINKYSAVINQIKNVKNGDVLRISSTSGAVEGIGIDSNVTENSNKLITSGAVFNFVKDIASLNRVIEYNPALSSVNNTISWVISLKHNTKALVQIFESSTNELVQANVRDTSSQIEITLRGINGNLAANSFYAIIIY